MALHAQRGARPSSGSGDPDLETKKARTYYYPWRVYATGAQRPTQVTRHTNVALALKKAAENFKESGMKY